MILEGIVTTITSTTEVNIAPMGPIVEPSFRKLILRPFTTSRTYTNLLQCREGVFHVTDDVLLLAETAIGKLGTQPRLTPATKVDGMVLVDACRYYEFRVTDIEDTKPRARFVAAVVHSGRLRDFLGFNRAKHAVVEAAILATRVDILAEDEIRRLWQPLPAMVEKTGGDREVKALALLRDHIETRLGRRL